MLGMAKLTARLLATLVLRRFGVRMFGARRKRGIPRVFFNDAVSASRAAIRFS